MGPELNQALVQQALWFAVILMQRRLHSCRMETEGFTGR